MDLVELEEQARQLLPQGVYDYFAGAAGDELTLADNVDAWDRIRLRPRVLRDVSRVDTSATVLGAPVRSPIHVAPTAFHRMAHVEGEDATARGATSAGSLFILSTRSTSRVEDVAAASGHGVRWYQVYVLQDRSKTEEQVKRAVAAGFGALVLTGDTPYLGRRLRDVRNAFEIPANVGTAIAEASGTGIIDQAADVTFDDIAWLMELSGLPVLVKGVMRGDDATACIDAGAAGVVVSNHGGRQLDGAIASADALREVVDAVGDAGEVYVDGGVRRGIDVVRALALGAQGVLIGRPVLWALASGGAEGVRRLLRALTHELVLAMALCGAPSIADISRDLVFS
ncbi:MAG: alpha-hydroxy-acid oxidizing protein [Actinobacteria bacterium]|nr:alpha-hydroxy-acid oxidizing protein [Actinomycetota bacterium]MBV9665570.1 alpha-hydroxy-acid oxidizing protein [Actinomycetota bacterium]MBV9935208.1 alpha-hydroxy-acid oxidizing protein [Actinomycetota bacterium]